MVWDSGIIYLGSKHEPTKTRHAVYDKVRIKQNLMKPISGRNQKSFSQSQPTIVQPEYNF